VIPVSDAPGLEAALADRLSLRRIAGGPASTDRADFLGDEALV
jgi:hypothetical protein